MGSVPKKVSLNTGWTFRSPSGQWAKAQVPGTIHSDLLRHRLIPDPHFGRNELDVGWVDLRDWVYRREFDAPAGAGESARSELVFEGLDTIAEIRLNGKLLGRVDNMFRTHRFDVARRLRRRGNALEITFKSPTRHAIALERKHGVFVQANGWSPRQQLRKASCSYGWDWGIRLPTSGIWRDVYLETSSHDGGIIAATLDTVEIRGRKAKVEFRASTRRVDRGLAWVISGECGSHRWRREIPARGKQTISGFTLTDIKPWMVHGYGEPNLYNVRIDLLKDGHLIDSRSFRCGFRVIQIEQKRDRAGRSFRWIVNGVPIWVRGANWIPVDSLIPRDHDARTRKLIEYAIESNMNCLRVWGGGVYESDYFYDLCDEKGILVWQDFMFACGLYPEHPAYRDNVRHEAEDNILRLRHHASLAFWCGNNENDWAYDVNWNGFRAHGRLLGGLYYHKMLPDLCKKLDPHRFYWPSSPYGTGRPNAYDNGDVHSWDIVFQNPDFRAYRQCRGRFISEFGTQGMPTLETFRKSIPWEEWHFQSPAAEHHQRHVSGQSGLIHQIAGHFRVKEELADFTHVSQIFQGEAVKYAVEFWRSLKWHCAGALYWQLNDVWPVTSWSSIDSELRPKALHFYARRFFAPVLATFQEHGNASTDKRELKPGGKTRPEQRRRVDVVLLNETLSEIRARLEIRSMSFEGKTTRRLVRTVRIPANGKLVAATLNRDQWIRRDPRRELIVARVVSGRKEIARNIYLFGIHRDLHLPRPRLKVRRARNGVEVSTDVFAKGVWLHASEKEIPAEDNYFDLLPGERRKVALRKNCKLPRGKLSADSIS